MRRFLLTATIALSAVAPAFAGPTRDVTASNLFANGSADVTLRYTPTGLNQRVRAGQFTVQAFDPATSTSEMLQVFCTDIFNTLMLPATYVLGLLSDTVDAAKVSQVNALLVNGSAAVNNGVSSAALQLSIWEVINEAGTTGYNLTTGQFSVTDTAGAVLTEAASNLARLADGTWVAGAGTVRQLTATARQGISYYDGTTSVPEPTTLAVLGAGLLAMGLRRRQR